jgi:PAP2 superfamily protein
LRQAWREAFRDRHFLVEGVLTLACLIAALSSLARFLAWVEARPGVALPDPILALLQPRDLTWLTFGLIYVGIVAGVAILAPRPRHLAAAVQAYVVMLVLRIAAMWLLPLEAPPGMLPLQDPLVEHVGTGQILTKDLFFSGHTSTLFLLFLAVPGRVRALFLVCAVGVGACVLAQHVHYAVDVLVAPFFAYGSFRLVRRVRELAGAGLPAA